MPGEIDRLEIQIEAEAGNANRRLDTLIMKLDRLATSLGTVNAGGLTNLAGGMERFAQASRGLSGIKTADFTRLNKNIDRMASLDAGKINSASAAMGKLAKSLAGMSTVSDSSMMIASMAKDISKLGSVNVQRAITNLPLLESAMRSFLQSMSTAPRVSSNIIQMTNALANLSSQGGKAGTAARSLSGNLRTYSTEARKATKSGKSLAAAIGSFYATCFLAIRGIRGLWKSVTSSMDFLETVNYFEVSMENIGINAADKWRENGYSSAQDYAESFSERAKELTEKMTGYIVDKNGNATYTGSPNLAMDPNKVLEYQAVFAQVSSSIGVSEESALNFSKALTMLGADWASLRNLTFDAAWQKFASALAGQSRAVRSLGIDITNATLQEYAYKYGLEEAVSEMNQAEKAQLRLLAMLDQSEVAFGDLANTIGSPANQIRMLQQNISSLARTIGGLFLPIVTKLLPYINGLIIALQRLFSWIGSLIGIKFESSNAAIGGAVDDMSDLVGGAEDYGDALDDAGKSAKKLKTTLGIDELNINNPDSGGGGMNGGMGGSPILDSAISDALADYELKWNEAFDQMQNKAQEIAEKIIDWLKKIWEIAEPTREALKRLWNEGLSDLANFTWDTLKDFYSEFLVPVGKWLLGDNAGLPRLLDILNRMLTEVDWGKLRTAMFNLYREMSKLAIIAFDALFDFFDYFLAPLGTWVMSDALPQLADILTKFIKDVKWDKINTALERFWKALEPFAEAIGQGLINFFGDLMGFGASFINVVVPGGINALAAALELMDPRTIEKIGYALGAVITAFVGFKAVKGIERIIRGAWKAVYGAEVINGLRTVITKLAAFADTIPIVTLALKGNKNAANALATFYPKLNSVISGVSNAFENFKANLDSGAFFQNTLADLRSWGESLSVVQKGVIGAASVFVEFEVVKNTVEDLAMGTENIVIGLGKIAAVAGVASAALYVAFGPTGLVVAAVAGVAAGIMGIKSAMDNVAESNASQAIADALSNPGGKPLSDISAEYIDAFAVIASQFDGLNQKSQELQTTRDNINQVKNDIDTFAFAMQNGATVTASEVDSITEKFQQLVQDSSALFSQQEEIIYAGLAGSLGEAVEAAGYDVETFVATISTLQTDTQKALSEIGNSIEELREQYEKQEISQDEYTKNLLALVEQYNNLTGQGNEAKEAVERLQGVIAQGINLDDFTNDDGSLNIAKLKEHFSTVADAAAEAKGSVEENGQLLVDAIQRMIDEANSIGDTDAANALTNLLKIQTDSMQDQVDEINRLAGEYTATIQDELINKIPELVNSIEEPDWASVILGGQTREKNIQTSLEEFRTGTISPIEEALQEEFAGLGDAGKTYAGDAVDNIMADMFTIDDRLLSGAIAGFSDTLTDNVEGAVTSGLDAAKKGVLDNAKTFGSDTVKGYNDGVTESARSSDPVMRVWMANHVEQAIHDGPMNFGSPSKTAEQFGADTVTGYNIGIEKNAASSAGAISAWMAGVATSLSGQNWSLMFEGMPVGFQTQWGLLAEWWNAEALPAWWELNATIWFSEEKWFELFENIKSALALKWEEIMIWWSEEALLMWWEEGVIPWFEIEKWYNVTRGINDGIRKQWTELLLWWQESLKKWWELDVEIWFKEEKWAKFGENMKNGIKTGFQGIVESIRETLNAVLKVFESSLNSLVGSLNGFISDYNGMASLFGGETMPDFSTFSIRQIPAYSMGGFPEDGLFMANHGELVGNFSNGRTAVANNEMIVAGIEEAAYRGFARAYAENNQEEELLRELIQAVREGKTIEIDGRELVSVTDERRKRNGFSFSD